MKSHRIAFDEEDLEFIQEYKLATGTHIQKFVREAVKKKIFHIKAEEDLKMLNRLKK